MKLMIVESPNKTKKIQSALSGVRRDEDGALCRRQFSKNLAPYIPLEFQNLRKALKARLIRECECCGKFVQQQSHRHS
jgi:DNA topoisomerase IA